MWGTSECEDINNNTQLSVKGLLVDCVVRHLALWSVDHGPLLLFTDGLY